MPPPAPSPRRAPPPAPARLSEAAISSILAAIAADTRDLQLRTLGSVLTGDATILVQSSASGTPKSMRHTKREYLGIASQVFDAFDAALRVARRPRDDRARRGGRRDAAAPDALKPP